MRFLLLSLLILAPKPAFAIFCENALTISAQVELCDDNEKFAKAAESCKLDYMKAVKAEQAVLGKMLRKGVSDTMGAGVQQVSEAVSASSYGATITRLDVLIARGVASRAESIAYISHFLPPFHWPADLGPIPRADDPELWKTYDGEFCFGEHRETIHHMAKEFDKAIGELRAARKEAAELRDASLGHKENMGGSANKEASATHGKSGTFRGAKPNSGASDITGVQQDKDKQK